MEALSYVIASGDYSFVGRFAREPGTFFAGCFIWVPISFWAFVVIGWVIQGDMDIIPAAVAVLVAIFIGVLAVEPPLPWMSPVLLVLMMFSAVALPVGRGMLDQRALRAIDIEQLEGVYEMLRQKPDNVGARLKLSTILMQFELPGQAIATMENAIRNTPPTLFAEEARTLRTWKRDTDPALIRQVACPACNTVNPTDAVFCVRCNSPYLIAHLKLGRLGSVLARRLLITWIVAMVGLAGIPLSVAVLPAPAAIFFIFAYLAVAAWIVFRTFTQRPTA